MSDGVLTRALADLARAGIPLTAALDPARREDILRAPGIGPKAYDRLQETAAIAADLQVAPKRARGGAGRGQGRKPIKQGEDTVTVPMRMAIGQRAKLKRLGGGAWFRSQIDAAVEP